jgi:platelet-activating factor acetylhydrolase IB subunit beta/gamma
MIADGIMAVVHLIREKQPQAHIIVMVGQSTHMPNCQPGNICLAQIFLPVILFYFIYLIIYFIFPRQSLLPRGHLVNPLRQRNAQVNELLAHKTALMTRVQLVNTAPDFVLPDGSISHLDMYDYLHLTPNGYRKVFEPLHDLLIQLLAETNGTQQQPADEQQAGSSSSSNNNNAQSLLHKGP